MNTINNIKNTTVEWKDSFPDGKNESIKNGSICSDGNKLWTVKKVSGEEFNIPLIYNKDAINYDAGMVIHDCITKTSYTQEEANKLPANIRRRLTLVPRKMGA